MTHYHACVWIDHQQAKVFGIGAGEAETHTILDQQPRHHIHRKADHIGLGTQGVDKAFLDEIAKALQPAKAILIAGPGKAKSELAGHLKAHFPAIAKKVWGVEPMDHPTDPQIAAAARKYFKAADRMHGIE